MATMIPGGIEEFRTEGPSTPAAGSNGLWAGCRHERITLEPINKEYQPIVLTRNPEEEFRIIAEFIAVLK